MRRAAYKQLCNINNDSPFIINANIQSTTYGEINIGTSVNDCASARKIYINQCACSIYNLTEYFNILWLTPLMDRLFIGPASDRCRFLDRLVLSIDTSHAKRLRAYEKMVKIRNHFLQETHIKNKLLDTYEASIANLAVEIAQARKHLVIILNKAIEDSKYSHLFIKSNIYIKGEVEELLMKYNMEEVFEEVVKKLYINRELDKIVGRCKFGPHRSDFCVEYKTTNMPAYLCSTGEQKLLLINLILSQVELNIQLFNKHSILLLDEVNAHLDNKKFEDFLDILYSLPLQVIMNGTEKRLFNQLEKKAQFINISQN